MWLDRPCQALAPERRRPAPSDRTAHDDAGRRLRRSGLARRIHRRRCAHFRSRALSVAPFSASRYIPRPLPTSQGDAVEFLSILAAADAHGGSAPIASLWSFQAAIALATLTILEIVLGIDNIIFISVLADKLPHEQQGKARTVGLALAMIMRILLLLSISWIMSLTTPIPVVGGWFSFALGDKTHLNWRDAILLAGGLFLIYKATTEIHDKLEGDEHGPTGRAVATFGSVITQILILDIVFSLDSVITAVGMVQTAPDKRWVGLTIMIIAVVIAVGVMLFAAKPISNFVNRHPRSEERRVGKECRARWSTY